MNGVAQVHDARQLHPDGKHGPDAGPRVGYDLPFVVADAEQRRYFEQAEVLVLGEVQDREPGPRTGPRVEPAGTTGRMAVVEGGLEVMLSHGPIPSARQRQLVQELVPAEPHENIPCFAARRMFRSK